MSSAATERSAAEVLQGADADDALSGIRDDELRSGGIQVAGRQSAALEQVANDSRVRLVGGP